MEKLMDVKKGDYVTRVTTGSIWRMTLTYRVVSVSQTGRITGVNPRGGKGRIDFGKSDEFRIATPAEVAKFRTEEERSRREADKLTTDLAEARAGLASTDFTTLPVHLVIDLWQQVKKSQK